MGSGKISVLNPVSLGLSVEGVETLHRNVCFDD